jgi:hypothetical protein
MLPNFVLPSSWSHNPWLSDNAPGESGDAVPAIAFAPFRCSCHFSSAKGSDASRRQYTIGKRTNALVVAAVAGLSIGASAPAQEAANAGQPAGVECYGINGCAANASCAVKVDDLAAVKILLGMKAYKSRFGKSTEHSCKGHGGCGASSHILNWTTTDADTCQQSHGIVIEDSDGKKVAKQL